MPSTEPIAPMLVSRDAAGRLLGCCARTVDSLAQAGDLPVVRIGRRVLFDVGDIRRLIAAKKETPAATGVKGGKLI